MVGLLFDVPGTRFFTSPAVWTPVTLGSALKAYFHAADPSVGAVTTWTDRIQGLAPTQASASLKPIKSATSFNSTYPGVTGDGVDDLLRTTTNVSLLPTGSTAGEIWMLCQYLGAGSTAGGKTLFNYGTSAASSGRQISRTNVSNVNRFLASDITVQLIDTTTDFSSPAIVQGAWSGITESGRINGAATSPSSTTIASLNTGTAAIDIFANTSNTNPANCVIAEILVTTALALGEQQQIEGYWAWNYGLTALLPSNHPYKNNAP
jgi:hypothetical protein